jgi:cytoskeleton protein RodZ
MQSELNTTETPSSTPDIHAPAPEVKVELGSILKNARESQKLTVEDVASNLRLGIKKIKALEDDDYSLIADPTLARALIRSYARFLKLNPEPLLEAHRQMTPSDIVNPIGLSTEIVSGDIVLGQSKSKSMLFFTVLIALILIWFFNAYQTQESDDNDLTLSPSIESEQVEIVLPAIESNNGLVNQVNEPQVSADEAKSEVIKVEPAKPEPAKVESLKPEPVKPEPVAKTPSQIQSESMKKVALGTSMVRVKLVFKDESWVSVRDKSGETIYQKLAKAGMEDYVQGMPPLKLHIGNVSGTQLIFNGEVVDLAPNTNNNIARISLGIE